MRILKSTLQELTYVEVLPRAGADFPPSSKWNRLSHHYHCLKCNCNPTSSKAFFCPHLNHWFLWYLKTSDLRIRNLNCTSLLLEYFCYPLQVLRQLIRPYSLTRKLMGKPCSNLPSKVSKCQVSSFQLLDEWVAKRHLFGCAAPVKSGWGRRKGYNLVVSLPALGWLQISKPGKELYIAILWLTGDCGAFVLKE